MFDRSPSATSGPGSTPASLPTGALSPVSAASCVSSVADVEDPAVGRDDVARLHLHDVTGNDVDRRHQRERAVSHHLRLRDLQVRQRVHARAGLQLLPGTEDDVEEDQQPDQDPRRHLADREAHHDDRDQHDVHRIAELAQRDRPHRRRRFTGDLVRPEPLESLRRVRRAQTRRRIGPERRRHLGCVAGERRRGRGRRGRDCETLLSFHSRNASPRRPANASSQPVSGRARPGIAVPHRGSRRAA